jgi:ketosteroid isomerase-like protein
MTSSTSAEIQKTLDSITDIFKTSYNEKNAKGIAELYTENAQILPPNMDLMEGKQAIEAYWQGAIDMGIKSVEFDTLEVESFGETAYLVAKYFVYGEGPEPIDVGKYISILKTSGKEWKLHRDIWNSSLPTQE